MFAMSRPLLHLLAAAGVEPSLLDRARTDRLRKRLGPMLMFDRFPRLVGKATGLAIREIARRNGVYSVEADGPGYRYDERDRTKPTLLVFAPLPHDVIRGVAGRKVGDLIHAGNLACAISDETIVAAEPFGSWTSLTLKPDRARLRLQCEGRVTHVPAAVA